MHLNMLIKPWKMGITLIIGNSNPSEIKIKQQFTFPKRWKNTAVPVQILAQFFFGRLAGLYRSEE